MPPKPQKKISEKQKNKVIEDKTFGLKNKNKSKKVAQYVEQVKKQAEANRTGRRPGEENPRVNKKEEEAARLAELARMYRPAEQKVPPGVDPKSILCQAFKAGVCDKGAKCKFSHDKDVGRRTEKINVYADPRADPAAAEKDSMDKWDQNKLEEVVKRKGAGQKTETDIICKYFMDALESSKYGWFWECPNGPTCHYRHALPAGFVLKKDRKKESDGDAEKVSLDQWIETERHKLKGELTPVTLESFTAWKKMRDERKSKEAADALSKKEASAKAGRIRGLSGRDLLAFRPDLFVDDTDASDDTFAEREYDKEETVEGGATANIDESLFEELDLGDDA